MQRENTLHRLSNKDSSTTCNEDALLFLLKFMEKDQLQELSDNNEKLEEWISQQDQVKDLSKDKEMVIASNKSLAEYNLKMEPKLIQSREYLAEKYEKARKLKEEHDTLRSVLDSKSQGQPLDTTHALLQTKAAQSEEETDRLSESFLDKQIDCEEFLDKYMEKRTETHLLKIKSEKLGEMIQQHVNHATWGGVGAASTHAGYPHAATHTSPYPHSNMMPQVYHPHVTS